LQANRLTWNFVHERLGWRGVILLFVLAGLALVWAILLLVFIAFDRGPLPYLANKPPADYSAEGFAALFSPLDPRIVQEIAREGGQPELPATFTPTPTASPTIAPSQTLSGSPTSTHTHTP
jgi:hypothetical protein